MQKVFNHFIDTVSGGDIHIVVTGVSEGSEGRWCEVFKAFQDVFGRASVTGMVSLSSGISMRLSGPCGTWNSVHALHTQLCKTLPGV